jgi:Spy/CpxP family protein refolding chaperone
MNNTICLKIHLGIAFVALIILGVSMQSQAYAQRQRMSPEDRTKQLKEQLNLTDAQADSVLDILTTARKEMRESFQSSNRRDRSAMREAMQKHRERTNDAIARLLTDEQKKKFDELRNQPPPGRRRVKDD